MSSRKPSETRIFFPWERRGGWLRRLGLHRLRPFVFGLVALGFIGLLLVRERRDAGVRQSRATLLAYRAAIDAYMADKGGKCPPSLDVLSDYGEFDQGPRDAWGRPLRFICPLEAGGPEYSLSSDGPDGKPGGLDRID
jgi:hypothetical protein